MEENKLYPDQKEAEAIEQGEGAEASREDKQDAVSAMCQGADLAQEVQFGVQSTAETAVEQADATWQSAGRQEQQSWQNGNYQNSGYRNDVYYGQGQEAGYQPEGSQNIRPGYQSPGGQSTGTGYQNMDYQPAGDQSTGMGYQSPGSQSAGGQNAGYQSAGYQNTDYQPAGYQNNTYQNNAYQNGTFSNYNNDFQQYNKAQSWQNAYQYSYQNNNGQPELEEPVKISEWVLAMVLMMIPCVNIIMMFVWAFSSTEKKSKSNFFKAYLIFFGISLGVMLLVWIAIVFFAMFAY